MSDQPAVLWTPPAHARETTLETFVAIGTEAREASKPVRG
jgi:hypothetical protein